MSSDSAPYGMSDLDIYIANRYGPKAAASDWANTTEDWTKIRPLTNPLGTPTADLALFEKLPSDIMNSILRHLDVKSFRRFRNINAKAHRITETVLDSKEVMIHGSTAVINLIRTGLSSHITIGEIHKALTSPNCEFCDYYGSILFLPTCTRTCHKCLQTSPRMAVIGSEEMLTYYPRFTMYGTHDNHPRLLETLAKSSMRSIKVRNHSRPGRMFKGVRGVLVDDVFSSSELGIDTSDPVKDLFYDEWLQYRTAASIHFPYLNTSTGEIEEGSSCKGCHEAFEKRLIRANGPLGDVRINPDAEDRDRCYSHKDFEKHFETCAHAQRIWMNRVPPGRESWFAANGEVLIQ
uniref:F-box domain-containing protein n=1 Tax=Fusarium oxysporum (strain Fo5176) TaxID=660025 RepID=A0A0D2YHD2_FUSOF